MSCQLFEMCFKVGDYYTKLFMWWWGWNFMKGFCIENGITIFRDTPPKSR